MPIALQPYERHHSFGLRAAEFYSAVARRFLGATRKLTGNGYEVYTWIHGGFSATRTPLQILNPPGRADALADTLHIDPEAYHEAMGYSPAELRYLMPYPWG